jgi:hypothetical protein
MPTERGGDDRIDRVAVDSQRSQLSTEEKILRIRRSLVVALVLALGLTGILLATLTDTAASAPKQDTTSVPPAGDSGVQPGGMGYDGVVPAGMGYDSP